MDGKIAIPVFNKRISPLFDVAGRFAIIEIRDGVVIGSHASDMSGDSGIGKVEKLLSERVTVIICSAISRVFSEHITVKGMELIPGVIGDVDDVVRDYLDNNLLIDRYSMPGCRWGRRSRRGHCPRYKDIRYQFGKKNGRGRNR